MKTNEQLIAEAKRLYAYDELEVDDNAQVTPTGDGTGHWVQAWVYVPTETEE